MKLYVLMYIAIIEFRWNNSMSLCYHTLFLRSRVWGTRLSRTLLSTLDSREMFASATAALRTPPCLFLYAGAWTDYMVIYTIKCTAAVKQLPASFAQIRPSLSLFSSSSRSKFGASLPTYLPLATSRVT